MEKITHTIQEMLQEKLSLYTELNKILTKERAFIVDMNVNSLWKSTEEKKQLIYKIEIVKERLRTFMKEASGKMSEDLTPLTFSEILKELPVHKKDKALLARVNSDIENQKNRIAIISRENKKYITDYLTIVDDIFLAVMDQKTEKKYSKAGSVLKNINNNYLINAEV